MARYLLPCSCGQNVEVEAKQAGLQVACKCGKKQEVPTLRGLKQLSLVAGSQQEAAAQASTWGPRQGITFLGVVVLLCGLAGAGVLWFTWPKFDMPDFDKFRADSRQAAMEMNLVQAFEAWDGMQKTGFSRNLNPAFRNYEDRSAAHTRWLIASGILAGVGGVMAGAALASGKSKAPARKT